MGRRHKQWRCRCARCTGEEKRRSAARFEDEMLAQELADAQEERANRAVAFAASDPSDRAAVEHAVRAAVLSEEAAEDEREAAARWGEHVTRVHQLLTAAERMPWIGSDKTSSDEVESSVPAE